jgi:hypothetical protein
MYYYLKLLVRRPINNDARYRFLHYLHLWPKTWKRLEKEGYVTISEFYGPILTDKGQGEVEREIALEALSK